MVIVVEATDLGIHIHRQQLASFNEFGVGVGTQFVRLDIEEEPTSAQDMFRIDESRRLFILCDEFTIVQNSRIKELRVVLRNLNQLSGSN